MRQTVIRNAHRDDHPWPPPPSDLMAFHRRMPGYAPTPLLDAPHLAAQLGLKRLLLKVESQRMGLPSFKILGASWATYQAIVEHLGYEPEPWHNLTELATNLAELRPFTLAAATDGNHGRAVAFMARQLGFNARILVPTGMAPARIAAIEGEGATVIVVDGDYDEAIARSAEEAGDRCLVVSDTSWPGYESTPAHVIEGYHTIFGEVDHAVAADGDTPPDLVVVPMGVGAFMSAAIAHYRAQPHGGPTIVGVEPTDANCVQASLEADEITAVPGPHHSIMVGLNCGLPSLVAWPLLRAGVDWSVAIDDDSARTAMRDLATAGAVAGETGAASLAGLRALLADPAAADALAPLSDRVGLVIVTEGATDEAAYEHIVGRPSDTVGRILTVAN